MPQKFKNKLLTVILCHSKKKTIFECREYRKQNLRTNDKIIMSFSSICAAMKFKLIFYLLSVWYFNLSVLIWNYCNLVCTKYIAWLMNLFWMWLWVFFCLARCCQVCVVQQFKKYFCECLHMQIGWSISQHHLPNYSRTTRFSFYFLWFCSKSNQWIENKSICNTRRETHSREKKLIPEWDNWACS